jgi:hypothetical protein
MPSYDYVCRFCKKDLMVFLTFKEQEAKPKITWTVMIAEFHRSHHMILDRLTENRSLKNNYSQRDDDISPYDLRDRMASSQRAAVSPRYHSERILRVSCQKLS